MSLRPLDRVHPEIAAVVGALDLQLDLKAVRALRSADDRMQPSAHVDRRDLVVPGDPPVRVRTYRPKATDTPLPCLVWMHGGGYVMGSYTMQDALFDFLCPSVGLMAISVEYRLAPEDAFPAAIEDCYAALRWTCEHVVELDVDANRLGVGGVSAGGGLAAAVALVSRDRGDTRIAFQLLDCPMLDDRQTTPSSQVEDLPVWSRESNTFGWRSYLGDIYGRDDVPYTGAPARATDLSGLPPALVSVGTVDGFLDEDVTYAMRLNHAGVDAELKVYTGACHGYQMARDSEIARRSRRDMAEWLSRQISVAAVS